MHNLWQGLQIPINVEASCGQHPRLKAGDALPRNGQAVVSQERLFALGTLTLQNRDKAGLATFELAQQRWTALQSLYADYLTFEPQQLITDADPETLTRLSEVVGVALGIAALDAELDIEINRFQRFRATGRTRRVDFEYYADGQRFFHETKGTTYETSVQGMCNDIGKQKDQTLDYLAKAPVCSANSLPVAIAGCTGSVALYRHVNRSGISSLITLIDPPPERDQGARAASESDELACVLRSYQNFYRATHPTFQNARSLVMAQWLGRVIESLNNGQPAPTEAPADLIVRARSTEPQVSDSLYRGSWFDARLARRSVLKYETFEEATRTITAPVTFVGISREVTELLRRCMWDDLLSYRDRHAATSAEHDGVEILSSGVLSKRIDPAVVNDESRKSFASLKRIWSK